MRRLQVGLCSIVLFASGQTALAGALTDGSLGPRVERSGDFKIGAELGTRRGDNLFHSFERFSIETGERATFTGPDEIRNVISRVTGGAPSLLDGELRSEVGTADFYFINPAGMVFGPNASLSVPAAFHVSTADELRFTDGRVFSVTDPTASYLSVAAPEAFGFLGGTPGAIAVDGSALSVEEGQALSLIGGDISIAGGSLQAPAGTITLASATGKNAVKVETADLEGELRGDIALSDEARAEVRGDGAGDIRIRAAELRLGGASKVLNTNSGTTDASGTTDIHVGLLSLREESEISADVTGPGDGSAILIRAEKVEVKEAGIFGFLFGEGSGGPIRVRAGEITFTDEFNPTVDPSFDFATGITTRATGGATGAAGPIDVRAQTIELSDGARIQSQAQGTGNAGSVRVEAANILLLNEDQLFRPVSGIASDVVPGGRGNGGEVVIRGHTLEIVGQAAIASATFGTGSGGTIDVHVDRLEMDGRDSGFTPFITASTQPGATGPSGRIHVHAGEIVLANGAQISSSARGPEAAGSVEVVADRLLIDGTATAPLLTGISASAVAGSGSGGSVTVTARQIEVRGGQIRSVTQDAGNAGNVRVVGGDIRISNAFSGISSSASGVASGDAGTVSVVADVLELHDAGADGINSAALGEGRAGSVLIEVSDRLIVDSSAIATDSANAGGGEIRLLVGNVIDLRDSEVTTSVAGGTDPTAGNILIDPKALVIDDSHIQANAPAGFGGKVTITADHILVPGGDFQALLARGDISATGGDPTRSGTIVVDAPEIDLAGDLVVLPAPLLDASALLREPCAARRDVGASSFTAAGRGGLPASPDSPLPSSYDGAGGDAAAVGGARPTKLALTSCAGAP